VTAQYEKLMLVNDLQFHRNPQTGRLASQGALDGIFLEAVAIGCGWLSSKILTRSAVPARYSRSYQGLCLLPCPSHFTLPTEPVDGHIAVVSGPHCNEKAKVLPRQACASIVLLLLRCSHSRPALVKVSRKEKKPDREKKVIAQPSILV